MRKILILIVFLLSATVVLQAQLKDDLFKKDASIEDARETLEENLGQMEMMRVVLGMMDMKIPMGSGNDAGALPTANETELLENKLTKEAVLQKAREYFAIQTNQFSHTLAKPFSSVSPIYIASSLMVAIDPSIDEDVLEDIEFRVKKIAYKGEDIKTYTNPISSDSIPNMLQIDSVLFSMSFAYPMSYTNHTLNSEGEYILIKNDTIYLQSISDKTVNLTMANSALRKKIAKLAGVSENDMLLKHNSRSYGPAEPGLMLNLVDEAELAFKEYITAIDSGKIDSPTQIEEEIKTRLKPAIEALETTGDRASFDFAWDVKEVILQLANTESMSLDLWLTNVDNGSAYIEDIDLWIANDNENGKVGLVDSIGHWVIEPKYQFLEYFLNNHFNGGLEKNSEELSFTYDSETKQLKANKFRLMHGLGNFISVQNKEEKEGIMSIDGILLIEPQFSNIRHYDSEEIFICENYIDDRSQKIEIYNLEGKKAIDDEFDFVSLAGVDHIEAIKISKDEVEVDKYELGSFVLREKQIFKPEDYYGSRYLFKEFNYDTQVYGYVNSRGNTVITGSKDYDFEEDVFHGHRALVCKVTDNRFFSYSYIDATGKLTSDFIYNYAMPFRGKYAYAEIDDVPVLIDEEHNVLTELSSKMKEGYAGEDSYYLGVIKLQDGKHYNLNGELLSE